MGSELSLFFLLAARVVPGAQASCREHADLSLPSGGGRVGQVERRAGAHRPAVGQVTAPKPPAPPVQHSARDPRWPHQGLADACGAQVSLGSAGAQAPAPLPARGRRPWCCLGGGVEGTGAETHSVLPSGRRLLIEFYDSLDPERRNKFPGKSVHSKLSLMKTLPSLLVLSGLTAGLLVTETGRRLYVKTWIYGTLIGCLWVSIKA